jgi:cell wall-associated NlpC family hydrolase
MNIEKYIGIPYVNKGRDFNGVDCWGLVWLFLENEMSIKYQSIFDYIDHRDVFIIERYIIDNVKRHWKRITVPKPGDIVLFRINGRLIHIGIVIDRNQFLHTLQGKNSCIERLSDPRWSKRIGGYYEFQ